MKCENCGGNLTLEEAFCPHCGSVNQLAQKHAQDMKRYQGEFQNAQSRVNRMTGNYAGITVRAAVIALLLIIIVVFMVLGAKGYEIQAAIYQNKANRNFDRYSGIMDEYIAEEKYLEFTAFWEALRARDYDSPYEKYAPVIGAGRQYAYLYEGIMSAYLDAWDSYGNNDFYIENIAGQLEYFYDTLDFERYSYYEGTDTAENRAALAQMEANVRAWLQAYCGLTEEDMKSWDTLSKAKRIVLLEERMQDGEGSENRTDAER